MKDTHLQTVNFGMHLMIDGYDGDPIKLDDRNLVFECLNELPEKTQMHKICEPCLVSFPGNDKKDPGGHSGFVMIAESHISIHTFPKKKFVSIDFYTCSDRLDRDFIEGYFKEKFDLKDLEINFVRRGTRFPKDNLV